MIFSKTFKILDFKKFHAFVKISILLLESARVLTGVENLASEYDCSNLCRFRDMTFLGFFSENLDIETFFQELKYKKFLKI